MLIVLKVNITPVVASHLAHYQNINPPPVSSLLVGIVCLTNNNRPKIKTSVEFGYLDSGNFNGEIADQSYVGLWSTGVVEYKSTRRIHFLGRGGVDFGGDNGVMFGAGMAINVT